MWLIIYCAFALVRLGMTAKAKQPNIVFVMADDYGYNDIGYHGSEIKTPNLDKLSAGGVRLENYYIQPICTPSRSQFMSGRYQIHTGLQHFVLTPAQANGLPLDSPTLADKLKESGYATHMVGKWHLGIYKKDYLPINRGFDTYYGYYLGMEDYYNHRREWLNTTDYYVDLHDQDKPVLNETGHYSTYLFTSKAIERINNHDTSKPMFLYLAYQACHTPLQVPEKYMKPYEFIKDIRRRKFAGIAAAMDEGIGNVTQAIKDKGMWENTVFVFSADNGGLTMYGGNNYPLRGQKNTLWDGGMHGVGFVVAKGLTAGTTNKRLIHISDWYPTFVGLAGGSLNGTKPLDGYDQWKTISKDLPSPRTEILHNIDTLHGMNGTRLYNDTFDNRIRAALRHGHWKLITGDPGVGEWTPPPGHSLSSVPKSTDPKEKNLWLFNVTADPTEHHDLSDKHPQVVKKMLDILVGYDKSSIPPRYPPDDPRSNPALHGGVWGPWE